jgi:RNA polymerase sigma-70 factor (ECF subfamily)
MNFRGQYGELLYANIKPSVIGYLWPRVLSLLTRQVATQCLLVYTHRNERGEVVSYSGRETLDTICFLFRCFSETIAASASLQVMSNPKDEREARSATEEVQLLFVRHENSIRAFVRALQPTLSDADDVMQETFLTVSRKASSFEPGTNFVAWACGIARLKVLEHFRQKKRGNVLSEAAINALAEDAPSPQLLSETQRALEACLAKLAPKVRDLLWRRYSRRQSSTEMAEAAGMTSNAVRVTLSKARVALRDCISSQIHSAQ